jgi:hypothetical protein
MFRPDALDRVLAFLSSCPDPFTIVEVKVAAKTILHRQKSYYGLVLCLLRQGKIEHVGFREDHTRAKLYRLAQGPACAGEPAGHHPVAAGRE